MSCAPLRLRYFKVPSGRVHDGQMVMIHASTEALLERVIAGLDDHWGSCFTHCQDDSDHYKDGVCSGYVIERSELKAFLFDLKKVKQEILNPAPDTGA